jgi:hypothetical protein
LDTSKGWVVQAIAAGSTRIIEIIVNYNLVLPMIKPSLQNLWLGLNVFASIGVMFGRIFDVCYDFFGVTTIRVGMAIVRLVQKKTKRKSMESLSCFPLV